MSSRKRYSIAGGSAFVALAVCVALILSSCLPDVVTGATGKSEVPKSQPRVDSPKNLAKSWLKAVAAGNQSAAISAARTLVKEAPQSNTADSSIEKTYKALFEKEGVPASYLHEPLGVMDFKLWYYAWMLKKVLRENRVYDLKGDDARLKAVMKMVSARIARRENPKGPLPWPAAVWARKYGLCDRMAWLYAEFAYQLGFDARIVYLTNPKTGVSPHTICEIRSADGGVWTADPYSGVLLSDVSLAKLAGDDELMRKIWPKRPDWREALPHSVCWIPAMPQDYRQANQRLAAKLASELRCGLPRFGEDPETRLKRFAELAGKDDNFQTELWFFPIRLLKLEMRYSKK